MTTNETENNHISENELRASKLDQLKKTNQHAFAYSYDKSHSIANLPNSPEGEELGPEISIAGRLMAKRDHGKATFGNIKDDSGSIQFYVNTKLVDEETFNKISQFDTGDIIGISGHIFTTRRGEKSVKVTKASLLSKALNALPEKYHGLQDKELRYRHRYVDLIVNDPVKKTFETRSKVLRDIRNTLENDGFMEVETPVLQQIYGGAAARPFSTHHNELDQDLFLRISLELPLKRLIVGGFEKVFEMGRVFRNEGVSFKHNPEYTLLELYQAYADYNDMMALTETLLSNLIKKHCGSYQITYQDQEIDFTPPFKRMTLKDSIKHYANVDIDQPIEDLRKSAEKMGLDCSHKPLRGQVINFIYDKAVEPKLKDPIFITDYPWETSPLAKRHRDNPDLVERFELIAASMELANSFSELNDPDEQFDRFSDQQKAKEAGDDEAHEMDEDYINALRYGMPPTGGLGIGIDRIVMLLTNEHSIRDVLFFPHMKTKV